MADSLESYLEQSSRTLLSLREHSRTIEQICETLINCIQNGGVIYSCGNGGSACEAIHFTEELVARYERERPGIKAMHFCDAATLTCWANDYAFEQVFERQASTFVTDKDVLVVFSTSGNSPNIISAINAANRNGGTTIALLGKDGGKAKDIASQTLVVDSDKTSCIQEAHLALLHIFCEQIEG